MDNPTLLRDDQITDRSGQPAPQAKPGNPGFNADVPTDNENTPTDQKPALNVDLTNEDSPEPKTVTKVVLEGDSVDVVTVQIKEPGSPDFTDLLTKEPVGEDGTVNLPDGTEVDEIRVVFESPKDGVTQYDVTLKVHVCAEFTSTTSVAGTTSGAPASTAQTTQAGTTAGTGPTSKAFPTNAYIMFHTSTIASRSKATKSTNETKVPSISLFLATECPLMDMMDDPTMIPDDQITDKNGTPIPEAKPGNPGYTVDVPQDTENTPTEDKPAILVDLTNEDNPEPKRVTKVVLEGETVDTVTILVKPTDDAPFEEVLTKVPVGPDGVVELPEGTDVAEIRVVLDSPKDGVTTYDVNFKIHVCAEFTTTTTTQATTAAQETGPGTTSTPGTSMHFLSFHIISFYN